MVDLATLTGAIIISLGHEKAGLFSNNDDLAKRPVRGRGGGRRSGCGGCRCHPSTTSSSSRTSPTCRTSRGNRGAGSITAAQFPAALRRRHAVGPPRHRRRHLGQEGQRPPCPRARPHSAVRLLDRLVARALRDRPERAGQSGDRRSRSTICRTGPSTASLPRPAREDAAGRQAGRWSWRVRMTGSRPSTACCGTYEPESWLPHGSARGRQSRGAAGLADGPGREPQTRPVSCSSPTASPRAGSALSNAASTCSTAMTRPPWPRRPQALGRLQGGGVFADLLAADPRKAAGSARADASTLGRGAASWAARLRALVGLQAFPVFGLVFGNPLVEQQTGDLGRR